MILTRAIYLLIGSILIFAPWTAAAEGDAGKHDLAKQSQNPIASLIVVPFENNVNFGIGPEDATDNVLNLKPVIPIGIGDWNLINRPIVPIIYQEGRVPGQDDKFGLGDVNYQGFFTPANPGPILWGLGPSIVIPTHTSSRLGVDKWSAGPAAVTLVTPGKWVIGTLAQNVWSFAGDSDAPKVNQFLFQYFINYNIEDGWYLKTTPVITSDWEADSGDKWTVPFGGGFGRLFKVGTQPIDISTQGFWNAEKPDGAADWTWQLQVKFLFPEK
jgi:hypothetical protein